MARYLVYTAPARGHLYPVVPTMEELRGRGHQVAVRTLSAEIESLTGLGFSAAPVDAAIEAIELDDWRARTPFGATRRMMQRFAERAGHAVEDLQRAIEEERPEALFVDANSYGAAFAAEASGLPWAIYSITMPQIPSPDAPPFGPGLAPRNDRLGRFRDRVVRRIAFAPLERMARSYSKPLRVRLGLPLHRRIADGFLAAPLVVYYTAEPFEYPHASWPPNVRLVGPGLWDPPASPPDWLDAIDKPLVLVTTSTDFQDDGRLVGTALEALAHEDVFVVATTAALDPSHFDPPANARVERFVPHGPLVQRASCVVCHGGASITQKSLAAGVPVCAVPFGRDQLEVARRVEVAGAGTRLPGARLRPQRLRAAVREAMDKREGARRIAEAFRSAGGPPAAADALEELL